MSKKDDVTAEPTLDEAKAAITFCRTFGGREAIVEYLEPLREFVATFGSIERFDFVLEKATEAFGVELSEEQKARLKKPTPKKTPKPKQPKETVTATETTEAAATEPEVIPVVTETNVEGAVVWKGK